MIRELYVLVREGVPIVGHTRREGAEEEMAGYSAEMQKKMDVFPVPVVHD